MFRRLCSLVRAFRAVVVLALVVGVTGLSVVSSPASADTAPSAGLPATVSADALPTWQINGVVWAQVIVGNTVYVTGSFTSARPPGVKAGGASEVPANNIFAYDITTGDRVASFNHSLDAQGLAIAASPDGSRVYVGGDFTSVDGVAHAHFAAFNTATNQLDNTFNPTLGNKVEAITTTAGAVFVGGNFFNANAKPRRRLAAFTPSGTLLPWAPTADDGEVEAMVMAPDNSRVIVAGGFTTLDTTQSANGMGSLDASTGAAMPWAAGAVLLDGGSGSSIDTLSTDGTQIYGGGYAFKTGKFEGTFAADPYTGNIIWANDCHGDTYGTAVGNGVLYSVSHAHSCQWIGGYPNSNPWLTNMHHSLAFTTTPAATFNAGPDDYGWNYSAYHNSTLLNWFPDLNIGTYTGINQAAWSVAANDRYVALGGEFPVVNNKLQQGLVRFAVPSIAPNKVGPVSDATAVAPSAQSFSAGTARVSWQAPYDMDNRTLTYNVYRSGATQPVYTTTADSTFWSFPKMGFVDKGLTPGATYTYTIKVSDPFGNTLALPDTNAVTISSTVPSAYFSDVMNNGASNYWRLGESTGSTALDSAGANDATLGSGVSHGSTGAISGDSDKASSFGGGSGGFAATQSTQAAPSNLSIEAWIKTTTRNGGKIVGYGNARTGNSTSYDRHLYMDNSGHVIFGVYNNATYTITSSRTYNDGQWHQIIGTLDSSAGMALYVDGKRIAINQGGTAGQPFLGYWRIGGDSLGSWPSAPSSNYFNGTIDDVSVYPSALAHGDIEKQYRDSGRSLTVPTAPTDNYGKAVFNSSPDLYWRLGDSTFSSTAADSGPYGGNTGAYSGGTTKNQTGVVSGNPAVAFNGSSGTIGSSAQQAGLSVYSEELWFKTTTTHGGKLIGFGDRQSGLSNSDDRHVYMENSGKLTFGTNPGAHQTLTSQRSYNDGAWHYMVATQGPDGMHLYVDGAQVASNPVTGAQAYNGYWRVGGDSSWGGDSPYFNGTIDEVAVYNYELAPQTVAGHFTSNGGVIVNQPPTASFTNLTAGLNVSFDASASVDQDGSIASYAWNFGDGTQGSGVSPSHTYGATGDYVVSLTTTDDDGATGISTQTIHVTNAAPHAAFTTSTDGLVVSADAGGSADSDGTIASYDWDWGDGTTHSSGVSPSHTYAHSGTDTVTLTVTDNAGGTDISSAQVAPSHNEAPTASFTHAESGLKASFDGSGSGDSDGSIASYAWDFGDGVQGSVMSPNHTYGASGDYTVTLTVTDDGGATDTTTQTVHVTNTAPVAAFGTSVNTLSVSVDGSGSSDADGSVAAYDWDWGDNTGHGSGVSPSHTYGSAGTYTVTLTVTDNVGGTGSVSHDVTVTAPAVLASDDFGRTVANGWGNADQGGAWTRSGAQTNFGVSGGVGKITMPTAPSGPSISLNGVVSSSADVHVQVSPEQMPTGSGSFVSVLGRTVGTAGSYRAVVNLLANGTVSLGLTRVDADGTARVTPQTVVPGLTYSAGTVLDVRMAVTGTSPTSLMAKVWKDGTAEPASWQASGVDSAAGMQAAGSVALMSYLSANATAAPCVTDFDSLRVYQVTGQQLVGNGLQRKLATADRTHQSHPVPLVKRTSLPFAKSGRK